jgi:carbon storage regulator
MLVLTRRIGETLIVGDRDIEFTILGVKSNQVKIGINAAPEIKINREELYERMLAEKAEKKEENKQ